MSYEFNRTVDYRALTGMRDFGLPEDDDSPVEIAVRFWMSYAWSAFCLQWIAVSWAAVIGKETA